MYTVYALYSSEYNKIYIGQTDNLERRLFEHNNGLLSSYTKRYNPWIVVYTESFSSRSEAIVREKNLSLKGVENSFGQKLKILSL